MPLKSTSRFRELSRDKINFHSSRDITESELTSDQYFKSETGPLSVAHIKDEESRNEKDFLNMDKTEEKLDKLQHTLEEIMIKLSKIETKQAVKT